MKNYKLGFSLKGFISFLLVMLPNIIWMITPPVNDVLARNSAANSFFDIILNVSRWMMVTALIILINKKSTKDKQVKTFICLAVLCLIGYYILWICYHTGVIYLWLFVGMAALPTLYFIFVELWLKNYIAVIPSIIFGITHILITCINFSR